MNVWIRRGSAGSEPGIGATRPSRAACGQPTRASEGPRADGLLRRTARRFARPLRAVGSARPFSSNSPSETNSCPPRQRANSFTISAHRIELSGSRRSASNACHRVKNVSISARINGPRLVVFNRVARPHRTSPPIACSSATSAAMTIAVPPAATISSITSFARRALPTKLTTTVFPSALSRRATARPIPPDPPVTTATR